MYCWLSPGSGVRTSRKIDSSSRSCCGECGCGIFFSMASFFHQYYMTEMAPAIAALFGIGLVIMWKDYRSGSWRGWLLPLALIATVAEQIYILKSYPTWGQWMIPLLVVRNFTHLRSPGQVLLHRRGVLQRCEFLQPQGAARITGHAPVPSRRERYRPHFGPIRHRRTFEL